MPQVCGKKQKGAGILNGSCLFLPANVNVAGGAFWRAALAIESGI
jgi:hypothetical protein